MAGKSLEGVAESAHVPAVDGESDLVVAFTAAADVGVRFVCESQQRETRAYEFLRGGQAQDLDGDEMIGVC